MRFLSIRSWTPRAAHAGRTARCARTVFLPVAAELEGRTLLSTLTVVNDKDSGPGSLPQEVALASSGNTIVFSPSLAGQTIRLTAPLTFNGSLTLDGSRAGGLSIIDSSGVALDDTGGNVVIDDMSISGSIHVSGGNVEVHDSTLSGGHAFQGGGIYVVNGNLEINHSTITGNTAVQGGGIYAAGGNVEINHSNISNNRAIGANGGVGGTGGDAMGGGLFFAGFNMEINHTDFSSNMAIGGRGGNGAVSPSSTVAGQRGGDGGNGLGGGMFIASAHVINLDHDEFGNNVAQGGAGGVGGPGPRARRALPGTTDRTAPMEDRPVVSEARAQTGPEAEPGASAAAAATAVMAKGAASTSFPARSTLTRTPSIQTWLRVARVGPAASAESAGQEEPAAMAATAATTPPA